MICYVINYLNVDLWCDHEYILPYHMAGATVSQSIQSRPVDRWAPHDTLFSDLTADSAPNEKTLQPYQYRIDSTIEYDNQLGNRQPKSVSAIHTTSMMNSIQRQPIVVQA